MPERGRPSKYSQALAERICEDLSKGMTLREVCRQEDMPHEATVRHWALKDQGADPDTGEGGFFTQYDTARRIGYHAMADETISIADDGQNDFMERVQDDGKTVEVYNAEHVQRSRLRIDTRKWLLSKALPKVYGDKLDLTSGDKPIEGPTTIIIKGEPVPDNLGED